MRKRSEAKVFFLLTSEVKRTKKRSEQKSEANKAIFFFKIELNEAKIKRIEAIIKRSEAKRKKAITSRRSSLIDTKDLCGTVFSFHDALYGFYDDFVCLDRPTEADIPTRYRMNE